MFNGGYHFQGSSWFLGKFFSINRSCQKQKGEEGLGSGVFFANRKGGPDRMKGTAGERADWGENSLIEAPTSLTWGEVIKEETPSTIQQIGNGRLKATSK